MVFDNILRFSAIFKCVFRPIGNDCETLYHHNVLYLVNFAAVKKSG
jgi:hypothetical protein